jgi:hypothetical protein
MGLPGRFASTHNATRGPRTSIPFGVSRQAPLPPRCETGRERAWAGRVAEARPVLDPRSTPTLIRSAVVPRLAELDATDVFSGELGEPQVAIQPGCDPRWEARLGDVVAAAHLGVPVLAMSPTAYTAGNLRLCIDIIIAQFEEGTDEPAERKRRHLRRLTVTHSTAQRTACAVPPSSRALGQFMPGVEGKLWTVHVSDDARPLERQLRAAPHSPGFRAWRP